MNLKSHRIFLLAGALIILATNAIALLGVAYNRTAPPTSELVLSERELPMAADWSVSRENSGMDLRLNVQTPAARSVPGAQGSQEPRLLWGEVPWLSSEKLKSLGFPIAPETGSDAVRRINEKLLPRDVYVVLDFDGPSHQEHVREAQAAAALDEQMSAADPTDRRLAEKAKNSRQLASLAETFVSRLYCVDAGLDLAALRRRYPDVSHYAIALGTVRTTVSEQQGHSRVAGQFSGLRIPEINVPLRYRRVFGAGRVFSYGEALGLRIGGIPGNPAKSPHYTVTLAWGRHLEPWIVGAAVVVPEGLKQ